MLEYISPVHSVIDETECVHVRLGIMHSGVGGNAIRLCRTRLQ